MTQDEAPRWQRRQLDSGLWIVGKVNPARASRISAIIRVADEVAAEAAEMWLNALEGRIRDLEARAALCTEYAEAIRRLDRGDATRGQREFLRRYDALSTTKEEPA